MGYFYIFNLFRFWLYMLIIVVSLCIIFVLVIIYVFDFILVIVEGKLRLFGEWRVISILMDFVYLFIILLI